MRRQNEYRRGGRPSKAQEQRLPVTAETTLLPHLQASLREHSRSAVKAMLGRGQITVNGHMTRQFDTPLRPGDTVVVNFGRGKVEFKNPLLSIIWEDDDLIVVNKREGLLSVSTERVKNRTAFRLLNDYVKKCDPHGQLFVLHRLDRDTSGIMMFAKNFETQDRLRSDWNEMITRRVYVAVVEGEMEKETDLIVSDLAENKQTQVYVTREGEGKTAITRYHTLQTNGAYSLVELELETGRKNQIRVQMQSIGHSVAGDSKYGAETNPAGRLMLHARQLWFIHPRTGEELRFETRIPAKFTAVVNANYAQNPNNKPKPLKR